MPTNRKPYLRGISDVEVPSRISGASCSLPVVVYTPTGTILTQSFATDIIGKSKLTEMVGHAESRIRGFPETVGLEATHNRGFCITIRKYRSTW